MPNAVTNASNDFVVNINMCPPNKSCIAFVINTPGTIGMTAAMIIVAKVTCWDKCMSNNGDNPNN